MIRLIGDIDEIMLAQLYEELHDKYDSKSRINITLYSNGGSAKVALAMHDLIKRYPNLTITGTGAIDSAAVLVLAAGAKRKMTKSSWVVVHEDLITSEVKNKRVNAAQNIVSQFARLEDQWNQLLEEATGTSSAVWQELHREEALLSAEECLDLNLVQEII